MVYSESGSGGIVAGGSAIITDAEGPNSPDLGEDDSSVGTIAWSNPGNVISSNNSYATFTPGGPSVTSHYLKATDFDFSIPSGVITGVLVQIEKNWNGQSMATTDSTVKLVKGGVVSGDNKALAGDWPTTDTYSIYGGSTDLWGLTLTPNDINAANFGVVISATGSGALNISSVDHIHITVFFTATNGYSESGSGGAVLSGTATNTIRAANTSSGGAVLNGTATNAIRAASIASGGVVVNYPSGPNAPTSFSNDTTVGSKNWVDTGNAGTSDNTYATFTTSGGFYNSYYLKGLNLGFSVPDGVTILGIEVKLEKKQSSGSSIVDHYITLVKGGTFQGNNKASGSIWSTSDAVSTYGGSTDLWGLSWTPADINASDFGIGVVARTLAFLPGEVAYVDLVTIKVYHTAPEIVNATYSPEHSGGSVVGGTGVVEVNIFTSGGVVVDGTADVPDVNVFGSGGVVVDGAGVDELVTLNGVSGGNLLAGSALLSLVVADNASGGMLTGDPASVYVIYNISTSGGILVSGDIVIEGLVSATGGVGVAGSATDNVVSSEIATGGIVVAGSDLSQILIYAIGGVVLDGAAVVSMTAIGGSYTVYNITVEGGVVVDGDSLFNKLSPLFGSGGTLAGGISDNLSSIPVGTGSADVFVYYNQDAIGGAVVAGDVVLSPAMTFDFTADGGTLAAGESILSKISQMNTSGGVLVSGAVDNAVISVEAGNGGLTSAFSFAIVDVIYSLVAEGGILANGTSNNRLFSSNVATGGIVVAGEVIVFKKSAMIASGGSVISGASSVVFNFNVLSIGGTVVDGTGIFFAIFPSPIGGGLLVAGSPSLFSILRPSPVGGSVLAGLHIQTFIDYVNGTGGAISAGHGALIFNDVASGGTILTGYGERIFQRVVCQQLEYHCAPRDLDEFCVQYTVVQAQGSPVFKQSNRFVNSFCLSPACSGSFAYLPPIVLCRQSFIVSDLRVSGEVVGQKHDNEEIIPLTRATIGVNEFFDVNVSPISEKERVFYQPANTPQMASLKNAVKKKRFTKDATLTRAL